MQSDLDRWVACVRSTAGLERSAADDMLGGLASWVMETSFSDAEARLLGAALKSEIADEFLSARKKASLLFVLRKVDPVMAASVAEELLEPTVQQQRDLAALLYHVVDYATTDMQVPPQERSTGLMDFEKNLKIAERLLSERGVFVPW